MKKINLLIAVFVLVLSFIKESTAQTISDWQLLKLDIAGHTKIKGVEAFAQSNKCKGEDVVYVRFVNHNEYPVAIKWFDAIQTNEHKWIRKEGAADKKALTLAANQDIKGDCLSELFIECIIKLKDYVDNPNNFSEYAVYHLEVIAVK
ncbi:MAG: hypothetical protein V4608_14210 [Bacteroidota bacterium]